MVHSPRTGAVVNRELQTNIFGTGKNRMKYLHQLTSKTCCVCAFVAIHLFSSTHLQAETHVVIIAGKGGTEAYTEKFGQFALQLHDALITQHHFSPRQITLFAESAATLPATTLPSRLAQIENTFAGLATSLAREDMLAVILFGHGSDDGAFAKLNLEGPDARDIDFARWLERLPCRRQVLINTTAASANFLEKLSRSERIVITATRSADEKYTTAFPEFFVEALVKPAEADLDKDLKISLLEAFDYARDRVVRFYEQANRLRPEHPQLDDNADGAGSEMPSTAFATAASGVTKLQSPDGYLAARTFLLPDTAAQIETIAISTGASGHPLEPTKIKLLAEIEELKAAKATLPTAEYERKIEALFIRLAKLNREIKASNP